MPHNHVRGIRRPPQDSSYREDVYVEAPAGLPAAGDRCCPVVRLINRMSEHGRLTIHLMPASQRQETCRFPSSSQLTSWCTSKHTAASYCRNWNHPWSGGGGGLRCFFQLTGWCTSREEHTTTFRARKALNFKTESLGLPAFRPRKMSISFMDKIDSMGHIKEGMYDLLKGTQSPESSD